MTSATNRTERLAKALKESRPDFTLHNARVFARSVIEAPEDAFGAKPLTYLPQYQGAPQPQRPTVGMPSQRHEGDRRDDPAEANREDLRQAGHRLPHAVSRPRLPDNQTRQSAIESWRTTKFALGVDETGDQVSWSPAATHALAVIGRTGTGKTTVANSLLDQARALGWIALHATVKPDETKDPKGNPGLVVSSTPIVGRKGRRANTNGYNIVVEFSHRLYRHRLTPPESRTQSLQQSSVVLTDLGDRDVPVLIVLDEIDAILDDFSSLDDRDSVTTAINDILAVGRELRVHIVLVANSERGHWLLPGVLADSIGSAVLAGQPDRETRRLVGFDGFDDFPYDLRGHCGRMALVERRVNDAGDAISTVVPFQAYIGGPKLGAIAGQYPHPALVTGQDPEDEKISFSVLNKLPDVLLDRQVNGRWEADPAHRHLDLWERLR